MKANICDFEDDIKFIPFINPTIIIMTYTSSECVRNIICQDNFPKDIYIDNDLGSIVSINEFINLGIPMN